MNLKFSQKIHVVIVTDDSCCEYHSDPNFAERFFREKTVTEANIYNSRFLTVNMYYYWFGGGPHGLKHTDVYIFDLSTGEELGMKNFYSGTEAEFAALIAKKYKKLYDENLWDYKDSTESSYDDSKYDFSLLLSPAHIRYYDDHITYCFDALGYGVGIYYNDIDITYEELNGNKELTRVR